MTAIPVAALVCALALAMSVGGARALSERETAGHSRSESVRLLSLRHAYHAELRRLVRKWRCVHRREGAWNASTGNGYHGGLQMDRSFQAIYGPEFARRWGTADRWPMWAQLVAAERAWQVRGWEPWPTTARLCGLL